MSDDQDLHMNSIDVMPNVQKFLAEQGTTYNKHFCTNALCCGYHKFVDQGLNDDYLPIWLQDAGVNTHFVGKLLNEQGVKTYDKPHAKGWTNSNFLLQPGTYNYLNTTWSYNKTKPRSFPGQNAINVVTSTAEKPFFLSVAPAIPHVGIAANGSGAFVPVPVKKWADAFSNKSIPDTENFNPNEVRTIHNIFKVSASWIKNLPYQNETVVEANNELYRARLLVIAGIDDMISDLVSALEQHDILDNTYIVYTTDNSYHIGQRRLGPGKKRRYETDINIPMLIRRPSMPKNHSTNVVTTHTDLAFTFFRMLQLPDKKGLDGIAIPITQAAMDAQHIRPSEHVNIETWGTGSPSENPLLHEDDSINSEESETTRSKITGIQNNTYKALRLIGDRYSFYYSIWCTNEHELYDMTEDPYQMNNLVSKLTDASLMPKLAGTLLDRPLSQVVPRLDALLLVLKSCKERNCRDPWWALHRQGNVHSLVDALNPLYDEFYDRQAKVRFSKCTQGYLVEFEGPQTATPYPSK
ncbi:putative arylsulfatase [Lojkania enalia]|uniref:Arylsulfatase n=1 Tax=Lojkania enalia TaxID=147567 RepID=A0A9P4K0U9_9PLEO|nr:putative arylsulfatase [Didymosphaeria enalia]